MFFRIDDAVYVKKRHSRRLSDELVHDAVNDTNSVIAKLRRSTVWRDYGAPSACARKHHDERGYSTTSVVERTFDTANGMESHFDVPSLR